jgi:hypothetical protein
MRRLTSNHAEDLGGFTVEPGAEFDPDTADPATLKRLEDEGKVAEVESQPQAQSAAPKTKKGDS